MSIGRQSIGRLLTGAGMLLGTAWMVAPRRAFTAWHCMEDVLADDPNTTLQIEFPGHGAITAVLLESRPPLDAALLSLDAAGPPPLALVARPHGLHEPSHVSWNSHGYPATLPELNVGTSAGGIVERFHSQDGNRPTLQLSNRVLVNMVSANARILPGISGGPVALDSQVDRIVGMICRSPPITSEQMVLATPIEIVLEAFRAFLPDAVLDEWSDGTLRLFVSIDPATRRVRTNISAATIREAWRERGQVAEVACDARRHEAAVLADALLRVVLHAPRVDILSVVGPEGWSARFNHLRQQWLPLLPTNLTGIMITCQHHHYAAQYHSGTVYPDPAVAASEIQKVCDNWVLEELHEKLDIVFGSGTPERYTTFRIAADVLSEMARTWEQWRPLLTAQPDLLHHFLALMVTLNSRHDCAAEASAGAGPRTFLPCLLPTLAFSLAVSPVLHMPLSPKHPHPGNLGIQGVDGHACGVEANNEVRINNSLTIRDWPTNVVLLPNFSRRADEWEADNARLDRMPGESRPTVVVAPPRWLLLPGDAELYEAIATSVPALRACVSARETLLIEAQDRYIAGADGGIQ